MNESGGPMNEGGGVGRGIDDAEGVGSGIEDADGVGNGAALLLGVGVGSVSVAEGVGVASVPVGVGVSEPVGSGVGETSNVVMGVSVTLASPELDGYELDSPHASSIAKTGVAMTVAPTIVRTNPRRVERVASFSEGSSSRFESDIA